MNVVGVGIDLVDIGPFAEKLARQAFREQVFTAAEQREADVRPRPAESYAGKFAVKEAVMKALGAGIRQAVWFTAIEVLDRDSGAPTVTLYRAAQANAARLGINGWHVSISHTAQTAVAVALALRP
jgi:holo-[acyl-carrier protein] synthase